ncbi:hypothetical protein E1B28_007278 [Marasmius oreades]|uniref:RED-like N-terminal domain-containing protein n=1 Tax=Marasmius oreades TaxID=181124 RepID=A0A9P7S312_9AGAR|nr:uncharacterized protein E1B28_007278 [Marasmius oreades]KAG7093613.1 hypothetical protein E1B28_007278 [Marasmius oreades]
MDQVFFRNLLSTSSQNPSTSTSRGSLSIKTGHTRQKPNVIGSSEGFKPRKVKKADKYRDRASERRVGDGNDYAQVEAVLEEFEKSTADQDKQTVDAKRRYLGGDGEHSILVKGLDLALLEQNKAKEAMGRAAEEDEQLEKAFMEGGKATTEAPAPSGKKRTREEIIRELKDKRASAGSTSSTLQEAELNRGKFKPIGLEPIGTSATEEKAKKRKVKGDGEKKKKKQKVTEEDITEKEKVKAGSDIQTALVEKQTLRISSQPKQPEPEPDDLPDDFDIFADAGDYEGIELGDDDEDGEEKDMTEKKVEIDDLLVTNAKLGPGRWVVDDQGEAIKPEPATSSLIQPTSHGASTSTPPQAPNDNEDGQLEEEEEEVMRLVPLQSSALPSIKDFLAMDEAAEKGEKKKKRKEKKKEKQSGSQMSAEAKASRDYQRLKSFTDKRQA